MGHRALLSRHGLCTHVCAIIVQIDVDAQFLVHRTIIIEVRAQVKEGVVAHGVV